jgi:hypothetical protein
LIFNPKTFYMFTIFNKISPEQVKSFGFEIQSQIWGSFVKTQRPFTTTKASRKLCTRKTMNELLPLIVKAVNILNRSNWCYTHNKYCVRGPVIANNLLDEINLLLLGSPCTVPCPHDTICYWYCFTNNLPGSGINFFSCWGMIGKVIEMIQHRASICYFIYYVCGIIQVSLVGYHPSY